MQYETRDVRKINIYDFEVKAKFTPLDFAKRDGLISHVRFLGESIFYVKNTRDIVRYDMKSKSSKIIGQTKDSVLAIYVTKNKLREFDLGAEERKREDINHIGIEIREEDEERKGEAKDESAFYVCAVDESETIYIFSHKSSANRKIGGFSQKIRDCKDLPLEIRDKDLFGMGYPYYIQFYDTFVAVSTDYGVCLLDITDTSKF